MEKFIKLKGILESADGGKTWYVSRIDYLATKGEEHQEYKMVDVPAEWQPCLMELELLSKTERGNPL